MTRKNVFVIGADAPSLARLRRLPRAGECDFVPALELDEIRGVATFDVAALTAEVTRRIVEHGGPVDGVIAFFDFPASTILPVLAERFGVSGPGLESVLKCEHKYWSRLEQQAVAADHVPHFCAFDPCAAAQRGQTPLPAPFWIKPVKSFRSHLGFLVNDEREFRRDSERICREIDYVVGPFRAMMRAHRMPAEIVDMAGTCLAESLIGGAQCTVEGYVFAGDTVIYGVVDSVRATNRASFGRYQYPSALPETVQHRMAELSRRVVARIGLDNACFDIEYFWDQATDRIWLLEINPRLSQSHAEVFERVHGVSHFAHLVDIALGREPRPLPSDGPYRLAANCHLRAFEDSRVLRVPDAATLERIGTDFDGVTVYLHVDEGQILSELPDQDSYSFEIANVVIGAADEQELLAKYDRVVERLGLQLEPLRKDPLAPAGTPG